MSETLSVPSLSRRRWLARGRERNKQRMNAEEPIESSAFLLNLLELCSTLGCCWIHLLASGGLPFGTHIKLVQQFVHGDFTSRNFLSSQTHSPDHLSARPPRTTPGLLPIFTNEVLSQKRPPLTPIATPRAKRTVGTLRSDDRLAQTANCISGTTLRRQKRS